MKVSVVGAGAVGGQLAFVLALKQYRQISLIDTAEGLARGKAMDIMQSEPVWCFPGTVEGSSDYSIMEGSSAVVITAGSPRKPGMTREDLFNINYSIIEQVCSNIKKYAPGAVVIVITNPLDIMTYAAWKDTGFDSSRVMGMGGMLDSARYRYFISEVAGCAPDEAEGVVVGPHGESMIPLSGARAAGKPLEEIVGEKAALRVKEKTAGGGKEIVSLLKSGSAHFAPAAAAAEMMDAVFEDSGRAMPACVLASGLWDLPEVYIGLEAKIGREGVKELVKSDISQDDLQLLKGAADKLYKKLEELGITDSDGGK